MFYRLKFKSLGLLQCYGFTVSHSVLLGGYLTVDLFKILIKMHFFLFVCFLVHRFCLQPCSISSYNDNVINTDNVKHFMEVSS